MIAWQRGARLATRTILNPKAIADATFAWSPVHGFATLWVRGLLGATPDESAPLASALIDRVIRAFTPDAT